METEEFWGTDSSCGGGSAGMGNLPVNYADSLHNQLKEIPEESDFVVLTLIIPSKHKLDSSKEDLSSLPELA